MKIRIEIDPPDPNHCWRIDGARCDAINIIYEYGSATCDHNFALSWDGKGDKCLRPQACKDAVIGQPNIRINGYAFRNAYPDTFNTLWRLASDFRSGTRLAVLRQRFDCSNSLIYKAAAAFAVKEDAEVGELRRRKDTESIQRGLKGLGYE